MINFLSFFIKYNIVNFLNFRITTITSYITQTLRGRKRLVKTGEELDTKKFTLADLIDWRPKTENTLRKKWDEKRQEMLENMTNSSTIGEDEEPTCSSNTFKFNKNNTNEPAAPRVNIFINLIIVNSL